MARWDYRYFGFERFPDALSALEIEQFFTLEATELAEVGRRRGSMNRLAVALQIGFVKMTGAPLNSVQLGAQPGTGHSRRRHRRQAGPHDRATGRDFWCAIAAGQRRHGLEYPTDAGPRAAIARAVSGSTPETGRACRACSHQYAWDLRVRTGTSSQNSPRLRSRLARPESSNLIRKRRTKQNQLDIPLSR
jgi:hypothetical protein